MKKTYKNRLPKNMEASSINAKVVDGEVIVEVEMEERFQPKDGDFLVSKWDCVFIYSNKKPRDNSAYSSYCGVSRVTNIISLEFSDNWIYKEGCRYATPEEKVDFLKRLEKEWNKRWNTKKKCLEDIYIPKFGDIVKIVDPIKGNCPRNYMICIWPKELKDIRVYQMGCFNIANIDYSGSLYYKCSNGANGAGRLSVNPASESEKQELFDKLAEVGKRWNPETKELEDIRWKPKARECYFYVDYDGEVKKAINVTVCDAFRISMNNCFKTEEAAKPYADQMKEIFKNSKAE